MCLTCKPHHYFIHSTVSIFAVHIAKLRKYRKYEYCTAKKKEVFFLADLENVIASA